eukprot:Selendium_serpulae@DN5922_c0_g1_i3.p1
MALVSSKTKRTETGHANRGTPRRLIPVYKAPYKVGMSPLSLPHPHMSSSQFWVDVDSQTPSISLPIGSPPKVKKNSTVKSGNLPASRPPRPSRRSNNCRPAKTAPKAASKSRTLVTPVESTPTDRPKTRLQSSL